MSFSLKIILLVVFAVAALFFGAYGLWEDSSGASRAPVTPKSTATSTPTATPTTKPTTTTTTTPTTTATTTPKPGQGKMLKEWTGTASKTTESFTITAAPWQVSWSSNPQLLSGQSIGSLQVLLLDSKGSPVSSITNTSKKEDSINSVPQAGTFTLQVIASNTQWVVQVWAKQ